MWVIRTSLTSPFGRKVRIGVEVAGLADKARIEKADTADANDPLPTQNPLGKIPVLLMEDGTAVYDSRVILEFLDLEAGGNVIVPAGKARIPALTMQALADGVMDAALLQRMEHASRPEEKRHQPWVDRQGGKVVRGLAALEAAPPALSGRPHVGQITLACALGYLDFRFEGAWRRDHPRLVAWLSDFAKAVPAFDATKPA
jgi:glutathione S-transferase